MLQDKHAGNKRMDAIGFMPQNQVRCILCAATQKRGKPIKLFSRNPVPVLGQVEVMVR